MKDIVEGNLKQLRGRIKEAWGDLTETGHQYRDDHRDLPHGLPPSETQNRQGLALQMKLDEQIKTNRASRNQLVDIEDLSEKEPQQLEEQFKRFRQKHEQEHF